MFVKKILFICLFFIFGLLAIFIILNSLEDNIVFFVSPGNINITNINKKVRIGGNIIKDSVVFEDGGLRFTMFDEFRRLNILYYGVIPAMFSEEQFVIAEGKFKEDEVFLAANLFIKHSEYYKPKN